MKQLLVEFNHTIDFLKWKLVRTTPQKDDRRLKRVSKAVKKIWTSAEYKAALETLKGCEILLTLCVTAFIATSGTMYSIVTKRGAFNFCRFGIYHMVDYLRAIRDKKFSPIVPAAEPFIQRQPSLDGQLLYFSKGGSLFMS